MKKRHRLGFYFSFRLVGLMVVYGLFCEKCGLKCDETAHFLHILGVYRCRCRLLFRCAKSGNVFSQIWIDVVEKFVLGVFYRDKKGLRS